MEEYGVPLKQISVKPNMHNLIDESINLQNSKRGQPNPALLIVKIPKSLVPVRVASPGRFVHTLPAPRRANLQGGWTDHQSAFAKSSWLRDVWEMGIFFSAEDWRPPLDKQRGEFQWETTGWAPILATCAKLWWGKQSNSFSEFDCCRCYRCSSFL